MKRLSMLLVGLVVMVAVVVVVASDCPLPPAFWCSSEDVARRCKVLEQCRAARVDAWADPSPVAEAPLVNISLYYESLCPFCQRFITEQLFPTFTKVGEILNVTIFPYGNAKEVRKNDMWEFTCQHGPKECTGNLIEACAIKQLKNSSLILPFVDCLEKSRDVVRGLKPCARDHNVDEEAVIKCYTGSEGNDLEHQMALATEELDPPHKYVPWVVVNGVHTDKTQMEAQNHLLNLVCETYTGSKPQECPNQATETTQIG